MMIKGKYVATITLDICYDEHEPDVLPFEKVKERITGGLLDKMIAAVLSDELGEEFCSVGLKRQYADLHYTEGGADNDE